MTVGNRLEGGGGSKLVQLIRQHGFNKDVNIELATVTNAPPELKIKVDNVDFELDSDDLIVAEHLTARKETVTIRVGNGALTAMTDISGTHDHALESFELTDGEVEYLDKLAVDDRVIVASVNDEQLYIILDKAVV